MAAIRSPAIELDSTDASVASVARGKRRKRRTTQLAVIPAKAGIQRLETAGKDWIPAYAGMTDVEFVAAGARRDVKH